jgi:hypothetical protein
MPATLEALDFSRIAGGYLRIISNNQVRSCSDEEITLGCAAGELLMAEARELAELVAVRRVGPDMIPYHFADLGFRVAMATLNLPPGEALDNIKGTLAMIKSAIRDTINDAKRSKETIDGEPV